MVTDENRAVAMHGAIRDGTDQYLKDNVDQTMLTYQQAMNRLNNLTGHDTPNWAANNLMTALSRVHTHVADSALGPGEELELDDVRTHLAGNRALLQAYLRGDTWTHTRHTEGEPGSPQEAQAAAKVALTALDQIDAALQPDLIQDQIVLPNARRYLS